MFDVLIHLGIEHADLTQPLVTAFLGFVAGIGTGLSAKRMSTALRRFTTDSPK